MRILGFASLLALILSILSAKLADTYFRGPQAHAGERIPFLGDFAGLQYSQNPGIAFGMQLPDGLQTILIIIALTIVTGIAVQSEIRNPKSEIRKFHTIAFGMIIGGGLANIIDRLQDGYVTDFFQIGSFPIFNTADSFVSIGIGILLLEAIWSMRSQDPGSRIQE